MTEEETRYLKISEEESNGSVSEYTQTTSVLSQLLRTNSSPTRLWSSAKSSTLVEGWVSNTSGSANEKEKKACCLVGLMIRERQWLGDADTWKEKSGTCQ